MYFLFLSLKEKKTRQRASTGIFFAQLQVFKQFLQTVKKRDYCSEYGCQGFP